MQDSFKQAKEALGKEYYPTEEMSEAEIAELLQINPEDYTHAFGQRCKNGKLDILISIKAVDLHGKVFKGKVTFPIGVSEEKQ